MDLAQTLIRSYARSFYSVEHILVLNAVIVHSALPGDDLAFVLGSQPKHTRKLCNKLRDDGLLHLHTQQEIRQGANRAGNREYYYINIHMAIDNIKWRLKSLSNAVAAKYGQSDEDKKDFFCDQCKSEYTELEVLDLRDFVGNFLCKRCGTELQMRKAENENSVGHEKQSRLNDQLEAFEEMMKRVDATSIAENEWDYAYINRRAVQRDQLINPGMKSEVVQPRGQPVTVHGTRIEQEKLHVDLHDTAHAQELETNRLEEKRKIAAQNQLPVWHTTSTVTGEQTELGRREEQQKRERETNYGPSNGGLLEKENIKTADAMEQSDQMLAYRAAMLEAAEREVSVDEDEDEDDDEEGFEDVESIPNKRVKLEDSLASPIKNSSSIFELSGGNPSNRSLVTDGNVPRSDADEDSDEDEDEFEDVM